MLASTKVLYTGTANWAYNEPIGLDKEIEMNLTNGMRAVQCIGQNGEKHVIYLVLNQFNDADTNVPYVCLSPMGSGGSIVVPEAKVRTVKPHHLWLETAVESDDRDFDRDHADWRLNAVPFTVAYFTTVED